MYLISVLALPICLKHNWDVEKKSNSCSCVLEFMQIENDFCSML